MSETITVGVIQFAPALDKAANLERIDVLVRDAVGQGATVVCLPEYSVQYGTLIDERSVAEIYAPGAEAIDGASGQFFSELARELGITLHAGSFIERHESGLSNTTRVYGPVGELRATYRKTHLFRAFAPELTNDEAAYLEAGTDVVTLLAGAPGSEVRLGLTICFDVRFPELYLELMRAGAEVVISPAAFPAKTGRAHWEVLQRARAIENQCYVIAPAQCGVLADGTEMFGNSMIVDPWGKVIECLPEGEGVIVAEIDPGQARRLRVEFPNLSARL